MVAARHQLKKPIQVPRPGAARRDTRRPAEQGNVVDLDGYRGAIAHLQATSRGVRGRG